MFGIGFSELILILVVALIVLGPNELQNFAKKLGQFIAKINNVSSNVKDSFSESLSIDINKRTETNDFKKDEKNQSRL